MIIRNRRSRNPEKEPAASALHPRPFVPRMHPLGALLFRTKFVQRLLGLSVVAPLTKDIAEDQENATGKPDDVTPVDPLISARSGSSSRWWHR